MARLEAVAVGWGGLAASLGLMIGSGASLPLRLATAGASFLVGGMLAGLRAGDRRAAHAAAATVFAHAVEAAFVALGHVVHLLGGPIAPRVPPGGAGRLGLVAAWGLAFALAGAGIVRVWLRPPPHRRRRVT